MSLLDNLFNFVVGENPTHTSASNNQKSQTKGFKEFIESELEKRAKKDYLFAKSYAKKNKSIDECIKYIVGEMYKECVRSGSYGFAVNDCADNSDLVEMAIHYYDEDDITITPINGTYKAAKAESAPQPNLSIVPKQNKKKEQKPASNEMSIFDFNFED